MLHFFLWWPLILVDLVVFLPSRVFQMFVRSMMVDDNCADVEAPRQVFGLRLYHHLFSYISLS